MEKYRVNVPEGKRGDWEVKKFVISEEEAKFDQLRAMINPHRQNRSVISGEYTKLMYKNQIIMSDTPAETDDLRFVIYHSTGNVLLNGLGLGVALQAIALKPEVLQVWVNEISQDVIDLISPHYLSLFPSKVTIQKADAFIWKPDNGFKFDIVWHDIWSEISGDNYDEIKKLHHRYAKWTKWQDSWCKEQVKRSLMRK